MRLRYQPIMPEVPNITENIARLREKRKNEVFGEPKRNTPRQPQPQKQGPTKQPLRSSPLSWLAIGIVGALFIVEVFSAFLFSIIESGS